MKSIKYKIMISFCLTALVGITLVTIVVLWTLDQRLSQEHDEVLKRLAETGISKLQMDEMQHVIYAQHVKTWDTLQKWMIGLGAVLLGLSMLITGIVATHMTHPMNRLAAAAKHIAAGDLQYSIPVTSADEIGKLGQSLRDVVESFRDITTAYETISTGDLRREITPRSQYDALGQAFQRMRAYLKEITTVATDMANGDLRHEIHPKTEHDVLGKAFQQLHSLRETIREMMAGAERVGDASAFLRQISADMAFGAEQTSQQVRLVSMNSQQISDHANEVSTATEESASNIKQIARTANEILSVMAAAMEVTNSASMAIFDLKATSEDIEDIVKIINTIAQQTNVLALNAKIEAARAGDMGQGFMVVASEVKELARRTTASLEAITRKIKAIQGSSMEITDAVIQLSESVHQVHDLSTAITRAVNEQTLAINEIVRRISNTAYDSEEISKVIADVASATQQVSEQTAHVQEAAQELAAFADQMRQVVKHFKV